MADLMGGCLCGSVRYKSKAGPQVVGHCQLVVYTSHAPSWDYINLALHFFPEMPEGDPSEPL